MKQVKMLDYVNDMLEEIVEHEKKKGNLGTNKQSIVNELIMQKHKRTVKND